MEKEAKRQQNLDYINTKINPILERLIVDLLVHKPENLEDFMIEWLHSHKSPTISVPVPVPVIKENKKPKEEEVGSDSNDSDENEDLLVIPSKKSPMNKGRTSVSAEAYGMYHKKSAFQAKVVEKTQEQKDRIGKRLGQAFMFQALDEKEKEIVINAMEEKNFKVGDCIIRQGDDGDNLYVVDSGELDCFRRFTKDGEEKFLKTYNPGESFGELALLYNAPRAATIKAKTPATLFSLDRDCFNNIVKDSAVRKREKYESFLSKVEILDQMDAYERGQLCDALRNRSFKADEYIIRQGEEGDDFFIVEEGSLVALKDNGKNQQEEVYKYGPGDYFGELALLKNIPRQASVLSKSEGKLILLDRLTFKRLLGPLEEIMKRNAGKYQQLRKSMLDA